MSVVDEFNKNQVNSDMKKLVRLQDFEDHALKVLPEEVAGFFEYTEKGCRSGKHRSNRTAILTKSKHRNYMQVLGFLTTSTKQFSLESEC